MNKFLRFSFWLIFVIVGFVLVLAFVEPRDVTVSRSIIIRATKEPVFDQIVHFKNWDNWNIIHRRDSSVKVTYSGEDGQPGSSYHWVGDEHVTGEGEMKNDKVDGTTMYYTFNVTKPGEMLADCTIGVKDTAGLTKVSWTFHKHFGFIANAALVVFNLDKYIGGDFEAALANLKEYVEQRNVYVEPIAIKEVVYGEHLFAGIRSSINTDSLSSFFAKSYAAIVRIPGMKAQANAAAITYLWDTVNKRADIMAALPVADSSAKLNDVAVYLKIPTSKAYMSVYKGGYSGLQRIHKELARHVTENGKTTLLPIEEYIAGPAQTADSGKWITNVYYLLR